MGTMNTFVKEIVFVEDLTINWMESENHNWGIHN